MESMILKKLQQGDDHAVEQLVKELYPKIFAYVYRRLYDQSIAKDITQETFYKFFLHIERYEESGKLLNYLYRIAFHLIQDSYKKVEVESLNEDTFQDHSLHAHPIIMKQEELLVLRHWVDELPPHLQEIVRLRYDENLKFKDISNVLGINASTIKSRLKLAIEMLKVKAKEEEIR